MSEYFVDRTQLYYKSVFLCICLPLCNPGICQLCDMTRAEHFPSGLCDHCSIIYTEPADVKCHDMNQEVMYDKCYSVTMQ